MSKNINNVICTNCKKEYYGQRISEAIGINIPVEYQCSCGYYIRVTNVVTMDWTLKHSSAYKESKNENKS